MVSKPPGERELARIAAEEIRGRLPASWSLTGSVASEPGMGTRPDMILTLTAPDGRTSLLLLELRQTVQARDIGPITERITRFATQQQAGALGVVAARYLSPQTRDRLVNGGLGYVDATGNLRIQLDDPALFVADRGRDSDPWRGPGRPSGSLRGIPAAKVVRVLTDIAGDWPITELVEISGASTGATYRVVDVLESEGLVHRSARGVISVANWVDLLRRWSRDYGFVRSNGVSQWIAPRGLDHLRQRISTSHGRYAVTGTLAAAQWAAYAPARSAMVYVADSGTAAEEWDLRPADGGANVVLAEPKSEVPFVRTVSTMNGLILAAPAQVVVDLMTGPGRNPAEAEELLNWMVANEQSWRG